jgi:hypothetical protein
MRHPYLTSPRVGHANRAPLERFLRIVTDL